jgi:hypothetical protein
LLVGLSFYDIIASFFGDAEAFNAGFMRSLRILRAGKVLRIFRLVKTISQLRLILNVLTGSLLSLFWSFVMMLVMYYICGLVFVQGAAQYMHYQTNVDIDPTVSEQLQLYFGSVGISMITMFQANTGGQDWKTFYDCLTPTGYLYSSLYLAFMVFSQIAFFNVLTALFVEHAIQIAKPDRDDRVLLDRQAHLLESTELTKLFNEADKDGTGKISVEEFAVQMDDNQSPLRVYLEADGIDVSDAALFFSLLRSCCGSGEEEVDINAFVAGLMKIRGGATSLDVQALVWQTQLIFKTMSQHFEIVEKQLLDAKSRHKR